MFPSHNLCLLFTMALILQWCYQQYPELSISLSLILCSCITDQCHDGLNRRQGYPDALSPFQGGVASCRPVYQLLSAQHPVLSMLQLISVVIACHNRELAHACFSGQVPMTLVRGQTQLQRACELHPVGVDYSLAVFDICCGSVVRNSWWLCIKTEDRRRIYIIHNISCVQRVVFV